MGRDDVHRDTRLLLLHDVPLHSVPPRDFDLRSQGVAGLTARARERKERTKGWNWKGGGRQCTLSQPTIRFTASSRNTRLQTRWCEPLTRRTTPGTERWTP